MKRWQYGLVLAVLGTGLVAQAQEEGASAGGLADGLSYHNAIEAVARGSAADVLHTVGSVNGIKIRIGFDEENAGGVERTVAGTVGTAELTAAFLLRNNKKANGPLSVASEEMRIAEEASRIVDGQGNPVGSTLSKARRRLLSRSSTGATAKPAQKLILSAASEEAAAVGRFSRILRNVRGGKAGMVTLLASFKAWAPKAAEAFRGSPKFGQMGGKLGGAGRFSTRQILYTHGAYNTWVATTGKRVRLDFSFDGDAVEAGSTLPTGTGSATGAPEASAAPLTDPKAASADAPVLSDAERQALSAQIEEDLLGAGPVLERLEALLKKQNPDSCP